MSRNKFERVYLKETPGPNLIRCRIHANCGIKVSENALHKYLNPFSSHCKHDEHNTALKTNMTLA